MFTQTITGLSPIEVQVDNALKLSGDGKTEANPSMFDKVLDTFASMENTQIEAKSNIADVLAGRSDDSHGALISLQKAELQMSFANSVRDKVVQGTNQLLNMQI